VLTFAVPARPEAVRDVRSRVRAALEAEGADGDTVDLVTLLTSELVTNAISHASGPELVVRLQVDGAVEVAVHDDDPRTPQLRHPSLLDVRGRGLVLVTGLARSWGTRSTSEGKWVWFQL
jgi:anti-sigma regulatory factor (Ser/Thr protein kinase)